MLKLTVPKIWETESFCSESNGYCGHSKQQHDYGKNHCRATEGEYFCWCKRYIPIDIDEKNRKHLICRFQNQD
jgi:hypothetical protein